MATKKPKSIEERLADIELRNQRVEQDKRWETSLTRRISICCITYICACGVFFIQGQPHIFASACIPVMGYILSTLSLPHIRRMWSSQ